MASKPDEFIVVSRKKAARKRRQKPFNVTHDTENEVSLADDELVKSIHNCRSRKGRLTVSSPVWETKISLREQSLYKEGIGILINDACFYIHEVECSSFFNGVSKIMTTAGFRDEAGKNSYQHVPSGDCFVYDPMFTEQEKRLLNELGMTVLSQNEEGKRRVTEHTLFYMPHCGRPLYNNLLWANWSPHHLPNTTILGNSFSYMQERTPHKTLEREAYYITKALPYVREYPISKPFKDDDVFNDTSFHTFPRDLLGEAPDAMWSDPTEPGYSHDVEIIVNNMSS